MFYRVIRKLLPAGAEYSSIIVYAIDPASVVRTAPSAATNIEFQKFSSLSDDLICLLSGTYTPALLQQRLQNDGQQVHVAIQQGALAAYAWVTTSSCFISEIKYSFIMTDHSCYIYDCYVAPSCRGRGVYQRLLRNVLANIADSGLAHTAPQVAYIAAEPGNAASIRGIARAGFRRAGQARYLCLGPWSKLFVAGVLSVPAIVSDLSIPAKTPCDNPRDGQ